MNTDILEQLGLDGHQSAIYRSLLKSGEGSISEISRATGLHRPVIYQALPELLGKQLVSKHRNGRRASYVAEPPQTLVGLLDDVRQNLEAELPTLADVYHKSRRRPLIRFFEGVRGIRHAYEDLLATVQPGDVVYRYESPQDYQRYDKYIPSEYRRRILDRTEIDWFIITNKDAFQKKNGVWAGSLR